MASFSTTKNGKFRAQVQRAGVRDSMIFDSRDEAEAWAERIEAKILKRKNLLNIISGVEGKTSELCGILPARVLRALNEVPYMHDEILEAAIPCLSLVGVYFLINEGSIVYVGQSINVLQRISRHRDNDILFDAYTIIPCAKEKMDAIEARYIDAFLPKYNRATPSVDFKTRKKSPVKSEPEL